MSARVEASVREMRRRALVTTFATVIAASSVVVLAGAGSTPIASKGKKRKIGQAKAAPVAVAAPSAAPSASAAAPPAPPVPAPVAVVSAPKLAIHKGTRVLVFGDSMVDAGFAQRLQKLVEARGGTLVHDAWTSSSTTSWSKGARLDNLLVLHKPDVVIIALGANEVFLPAPEAVAPRVKSIVAKVAPRPCYWVSPPLWKGETGIVAVERANAAPCGFFDSGLVKVERAKDGIHPTPKGGSDWADAVWSAIVEASPPSNAVAEATKPAQ